MQEGAAFVGVVLLDLCGGQPVFGPGPVGFATQGGERLHCLTGRADGLGRAVEATVRLGDACQQIRPCASFLGLLEQAIVAVEGGLPVPGGESEVGLEARPRAARIRKHLRGGLAEARRQVVEGRHRRLGNAVLECADVGLRVALAGKLLLRQPGGESGLAQPLADRVRQRTVIDDDATSGLGRAHGRDCTARSSAF